MNPVMQTIFPDEQNQIRGDCFRACVSSILEWPYEEVPHLMMHQNWAERFDEWLHQFGMSQVEICLDVNTDQAYLHPVDRGIYFIATGTTKRHPTRLHSVVARTIGGGFSWEFIHDPHPDGIFLEKTTKAMFFVFRDPSAYMPEKPMQSL